MKCEHCGAQLPETHFCPACGAALAREKAEERTKQRQEQMPEEMPAKDTDVASLLMTLRSLSEAEGKEPFEEEETDYEPVEPEADEEGQPSRVGTAFASLWSSLLETAGSIDLLMTALLKLFGIFAGICQGLYPVLAGITEAGDIYSLGSELLPTLVKLLPVLALFLLFGHAHGKEPAISIGGLGLYRVLSIIAAFVVGAGLAGMVTLTSLLGVMELNGTIPMTLPLPAFLPAGNFYTAFLWMPLAVLMLHLTLAFIYQIKLAGLLRDAAAIGKGRLARLRTGYLRFFNGLLTAVLFLTALIFAAMMFSGGFIVSLVRELGYAVSAETEAMTIRMAPVIFGMAAAANFFGAASRFFAGRIFLRAKRAMREFDRACGDERV